MGLLHDAGYADVRLRIAGIPPEGPGNEFYAARARKHGVMESIDWLGRLDAEQLVAELLGAAVFAYPSHIDNSPNALCEALLVGVPTVASYVGGVPSLIDDGREGLLYPDGDPYALAGRIRYLLDNPSFAAEVGQESARTGSAPARSRLDRRPPAGHLREVLRERSRRATRATGRRTDSVQAMTRVCIVKQHTTYDLFTRTGPDLQAIVASSNWRSGPIGLWEAFDTSARIVLEDPAPECQLGKQHWSQYVQGWDLWPAGSTADDRRRRRLGPVRHRHLDRRRRAHAHRQALSRRHVVLLLHRGRARPASTGRSAAAPSSRYNVFLNHRLAKKPLSPASRSSRQMRTSRRAVLDFPYYMQSARSVRNLYPELATAPRAGFCLSHHSRGVLTDGERAALAEDRSGAHRVEDDRRHPQGGDPVLLLRGPPGQQAERGPGADRGRVGGLPGPRTAATACGASPNLLTPELEFSSMDGAPGARPHPGGRSPTARAVARAAGDARSTSGASGTRRATSRRMLQAFRSSTASPGRQRRAEMRARAVAAGELAALRMARRARRALR